MAVEGRSEAVVTVLCYLLVV